MIVLPAAQFLHQSSAGMAPRAATKASAASNAGCVIVACLLVRVLSVLEMQGQHAESLGGVQVMGQCRKLVHLNLKWQWHSSSWGRQSCRSVGAVPSAGSPRSRCNVIRRSRGKEFGRSAGAVHSAGLSRSQSLWVVATQVRASLTTFEVSSFTSSTHQVGRKARLNAALHLKLPF